jgi:uncharacterized protein YmfQ (DUF2313 family)
MAGRSLTDYLRHLQSLLPRGRAWSRDDSSRLVQFLKGMAGEFVRLEARALELLDERDTRLTSDLLVDHEYDLGLPDECSELGATIAKRRLEAHAKLIALGGQSKPYFIGLAEALGYVMEIEEYPTGGLASIFHWRAIVDYNPSTYLVWFTSGGSTSGDPISYITGIETLTCFLERYKPSHTKLFVELDGPEYGRGFNLAFDSLLSATGYGAFGLGFDISFDVAYGGAFDFQEFGNGFSKQG